MFDFNKIKFNYIRNIKKYSFHTYCMKDVLLTKRTISHKNFIEIKKETIEKLLKLNKILDGKNEFKITKNLIIKNKKKYGIDVFKLHGIKNNFGLLNINNNDVQFLLEIYKHIKNKKMNYIRILPLERLTIIFNGKSENTYVFLNKTNLYIKKEK